MNNEYEKNYSITNTDADLVELAGYHAYSEYRFGDRIKVNQSEYEVLDTNYKRKSGLDAQIYLQKSILSSTSARMLIKQKTLSPILICWQA
ncbi:hypothetical protein J416_04181 [Gracilibacillus halophilus YIM-C55.5]|uniref:Uncharacterized protein n=1 Tax=Gracilibacillus halophilus YIM-C55.5 TaxID=1308866 RepID=N4WNL3_9BACI|nr:hypothetical protein J416_04181 [Gracilibacillus halophilus YIM-C55.5]